MKLWWAVIKWQDGPDWVHGPWVWHIEQLKPFIFLRPELRPTCREFKDKKMWVQICSSDPFPVGLRVWFLAFCRPLLLVNDGRHWCFLWINYLHLHQWQRTARRGRPGLEPGHTPENYCWENTHTHTHVCVHNTNLQNWTFIHSFCKTSQTSDNKSRPAEACLATVRDC